VSLNAAGLRATVALANSDVLLDVVDALDEDAILLSEHLNDATLLTAVTATGFACARDDLNQVTFFDLCHC
jgi:hypothetical protein